MWKPADCIDESGHNLIDSPTILSRIHPDDLATFLRKLVHTDETGEPLIAEHRVVLPDGGTRYVEMRGEPSRDATGNVAAVYGAVIDVTEKKILEDHLIKSQKLKSIGTLAGGLAHDYNNLLVTIMGNIELAKMDVTEAGAAFVMLNKAEKAAMAARDLTDQLLMLSQGGYPISRIMPIYGSRGTRAQRIGDQAAAENCGFPAGCEK